MDNHDHNGTGEYAGRQGRWVSEGGRLRWVPAEEYQFSIDEVLGQGEALATSLTDAEAQDSDTWASDTPHLPDGAPESYRARAAFAWLERKRDLERASADEFALVERQRQRQLDAEETPQPRRRRHAPEPASPAAIAMARHDAATEWFQLAHEQLQEALDRSSGRALVEWYLWLLNEPPLTAADPNDATAVARVEGDLAARNLTRNYAERLAIPEMDDEE